jgi:hypothetical protein
VRERAIGPIAIRNVIIECTGFEYGNVEVNVIEVAIEYGINDNLRGQRDGLLVTTDGLLGTSLSKRKHFIMAPQ